MSDYAINISGTVPNILHYQDGKLFCNDGNGFQILDADKGTVLYDSNTTANYIPWTPPKGVTNLRLVLK